jgi:Xaa-Pro aminopeptidase
LSARDPDVAALLGPVHLAEPFLILPRGQELHLGYAMEMERDEAAASGLALLNPRDLGLAGLSQSDIGAGERLARTWLAGLAALDLDEGRLALAGLQKAGPLLEAVGRLAEAGWQVESAEQMLMGFRRRKTAWEVAEIRRSAEGVCAAMRGIASVLARAEANGDFLYHDGRPLTAGDLRRIVDLETGRRGLGQPEGNIVSAGADAAVPHTQGSSERQLKVGESIIVDLYPKGHLFADCTRTFCVGNPPERLRTAHAVVREVLDSSAAEVTPGVLGADLQAAACDRFESRGYDTHRSKPSSSRGFVHSLGHGVGFEIHEPPRYNLAGAAGTFAVGDVFALEPALYDPDGAWGVRLENLYLMGDQGPELLTGLPLDLDPVDW